MTTEQRPGLPTEEPRASLSLLDYRRRVADLYARVRDLPPDLGHDLWHRERETLFREHNQSPIRAQHRARFGGLTVWPYDPEFRFEAEVSAVDDPAGVALPLSGGGATRGRAVGAIRLPLHPGGVVLTLYRLDQYGDHLILPFADGTAGTETYGGGRYLIDTAKGADLGGRGDQLVLDFNFAYHPSCAHDPVWSCPLPPAVNRFAVPIRAGERLDGDG
jgi:uncharacterized protein (DUF1684 family)